MPRVEVLPPRGARELDMEVELARIERLANLLDAWIELPGTKIRVGLDSIVGLIPGVGDGLTFLASIYVVDRLSRLGLSSLTRTRMIGNVLIDLLIGAIPVLGDVFDVGFRANIRNLELARRELGLD